MIKNAKTKMIEFRYDVQLLIEGHDLDEDAVNDYFLDNFKGDCPLAVRHVAGRQ